MVAKTLYDTDFAECADKTAELIRDGRFNEIDAANVAEEIASLGRAGVEPARYCCGDWRQLHDSSAYRGGCVRREKELEASLRNMFSAPGSVGAARSARAVTQPERRRASYPFLAAGFSALSSSGSADPIWRCRRNANTIAASETLLTAAPAAGAPVAAT